MIADNDTFNVELDLIDQLDALNEDQRIYLACLVFNDKLPRQWISEFALFIAPIHPAIYPVILDYLDELQWQRHDEHHPANQRYFILTVYLEVLKLGKEYLNEYEAGEWCHISHGHMRDCAHFAVKFAGYIDDIGNIDRKAAAIAAMKRMRLI